MGIKVSALTNVVADLGLTDLMYVAEDLGGGSYQSSKMSYQNLLNNLDTDINFPDTIYSGDNSLSGNREISVGSFSIGFTGTGNFGIGILGTSATDKLQIVGNTRCTGLKVNVSSFSHVGLDAEVLGNTKVGGRLSVGDDGGNNDNAIATGIATFNSPLHDIKLWVQASDPDQITLWPYNKNFSTLKNIRLAGSRVSLDSTDIRVGLIGTTPSVLKTFNILGSTSVSDDANIGASLSAGAVSLVNERQSILKELVNIGDGGLASTLILSIDGAQTSTGKGIFGTGLALTDETLSSLGESNLSGKVSIGSGLLATDTSLELSGFVNFQNATQPRSAGNFGDWTEAIRVKVQGIEYELAAKIV